jgi:MFS family permease
MNSLSTSLVYNPKRLTIWLVSVLFLLFQFFLQLSSGIIIGAIMQEKALNAFSAGLLSSAFYYVYTSMQIPVGLLFDRFNIRSLLSISALVCAFGCFLFAAGYNLWILFLGRLIIGGGSAFAFVGMTRILRQYYPIKQYAFMIGLTETIGFTVTVLSMIGMGSQINRISWHYFLTLCGFIGLLIAILCAIFIPNEKPLVNNYHFKQHLIHLLKNKLVWINGLFVGLEFSVITVFAAMWAVPFLKLKLHCSLEIASILSSMVLLGAGLSCPLYGWLSIHFSKRKPLIHISCLSTAVLFLLVLYLPLQHLLLTGILLFAIGLCCGAYMLAFTIANELAPAESMSACTGFTNTLAMTSAPLLQPLIGYLLDFVKGNAKFYTLADYQVVFLIIPAALVIATVLSQFLPEKEF